MTVDADIKYASFPSIEALPAFTPEEKNQMGKQVLKGWGLGIGGFLVCMIAGAIMLGLGKNDSALALAGVFTMASGMIPVWVAKSYVVYKRTLVENRENKQTELTARQWAWIIGWC